MASLGDLFITVGAKIDGFKAAMSEVGAGVEGAADGFKSFGDKATEWIEHPLESAKSAISSVVASLGPVGVAAGVAATGFALVAKELGGMVLEAGEAVEATNNLAAQLNLGFGETRKLSDMAQIAGVSLGTLGRVSMALADALEDPEGRGKKVAEALDGMGISATSSGDALLQVLKKLSEIPDATERIAKAHEIMGRGAVQLEPLLKDYAALSAAVDDLGGKLSKETIDKLLAADDAADKLSISWRNLKEAIAGTVATPVGGVLDVITKLISEGPKLSFLETQWGGVTEEVKKTTEAVKENTATTFNAGKASREYNAELDKSNKAQKEAGKEIKKHQDALDKLAKESLAEATAAFHDLGIVIGGSGDGTVSRLNKMQDSVKLLEKAWQDGKIPTGDYMRALAALHQEADKTKIKDLEAQVKVLNQQYKDGLISTREYTVGQRDLNEQILKLSPNLKVVAQSAEAFEEELAKLDATVKATSTSIKNNEAQNVALQSTLDKLSTDAPQHEFIDLNQAVEEACAESKTRFDTLANDIGGSVTEMLHGSLSVLLGGPGSIGDKFKRMMGEMRESLLNTFLKPVEDALNDFIVGTIKDLIGGKGFGGILDSVKGIGSAIKDVFGGGGSSAVGAATTAATSAAEGGIQAAGSVGSSAAGAAGTVASTGAMAVAGLVTGIVSAVSGVIGNFQFMAMNKSLDLIEHSTRYSEIHLFHTLEQALTWWPKLDHLVDIWGAINTVRDALDFGITDRLTEISQNTLPLRNMSFAGGQQITIDMRGAVISDDRAADALFEKLTNRLREVLR